MRLVVTGAGGMVGAEVARQALASGFDCTAFTHSDLDITDAQAVASRIGNLRPEVVINAAAYTAVDKAESDEARATLVNGAGAGNVAVAANEAGAAVIHLSTDYVFDGSASKPYRPSDRTNPINAYGRSKLAGEAAVRAACSRHAIIRTSWVYSHEGHNFVRTMLRLAASRNELKIVDDQQGSPTSAADVAAALLETARALRERTVSGTYHFTNSGVTNWYEFATAIFKFRGLTNLRVRPVSSAEFTVPAKRPAWSVLDCSTFQKEFNVSPRPWRSALQETLNNIQ